ncbi:MAG: MBL fold metallo-hydrolase [Leptospirales bacterium]
MRFFQHKDVTVRYVSAGGVESCYILPEQKIAFDMGRGPFELVDIPNVFLSHGHLDHAAGIAYYFSQRSLKGLDPGTVYVPKNVVRPLKNICRQWQKIEGFGYKINIIAHQPGKRISVGNGYSILALEAYHRISANGYILYKQTKKLKPEYKGLPGPAIKKLKDEGKEVVTLENRPLFVYSGDTTVEFLTQHPDVKRARVLFMECTYIDEKRPVERARRWGHTHLDEILNLADELENEKIVLVHLSRRYDKEYIQKILSEKVPKRHQEKIVYGG